MSMTQINLDSATLAALDACAEFRSLSREEMLREAINEAAEYDRYYRKEVEAGLRDTAAHRIISNDQMKTEMLEFSARLKASRS